MTKRYIVDDNGGYTTIFSTNKTDAGVVVMAESGYNLDVKELLTLADTGNGFVSLCHSYSSYKQDNYVCLDYAEAEYLYYAIGEALKLRKKKAKRVL